MSGVIAPWTADDRASVIAAISPVGNYTAVFTRNRRFCAAGEACPDMIIRVYYLVVGLRLVCYSDVTSYGLALGPALIGYAARATPSQHSLPRVRYRQSMFLPMLWARARAGTDRVIADVDTLPEPRHLSTRYRGFDTGNPCSYRCCGLELGPALIGYAARATPSQHSLPRVRYRQSMFLPMLWARARPGTDRVIADVDTLPEPRHLSTRYRGFDTGNPCSYRCCGLELGPALIGYAARATLSQHSLSRVRYRQSMFLPMLWARARAGTDRVIADVDTLPEPRHLSTRYRGFDTGNPCSYRCCGLELGPALIGYAARATPSQHSLPRVRYRQSMFLPMLWARARPGTDRVIADVDTLPEPRHLSTRYRGFDTGNRCSYRCCGTTIIRSQPCLKY
ncbi:hypothetical protein J6590_021093 [Homalodisca vitripennis]|nr:hypothetical protein J6590_021093 [Homalodisca vitripennis]